ncbi:hypothetical protein BDR04DRAFT_1232236 [Suillus decipiens]|nr:hypothetical protein BDR04DRAFT_1232236 [Suillus decipiens]
MLRFLRPRLRPLAPFGIILVFPTVLVGVPPVILFDQSLSTISPTAFETDLLTGASRPTFMTALNSIGLHYSFFLLVILVDRTLPTISLPAFKTDSPSEASHVPSCLGEAMKLNLAALFLNP